MKHEDFDKMLMEQLDTIKRVLSSKAKEYATDDRLHNFKRAARVSEETAAKALKGMVLKHLVSVFDLIDAYDPESKKPQFSKELIDEKITDILNYFILLKGLFMEQHLK